MELKEVMHLLNGCLQELKNNASVKEFDGGTFVAWKNNVRAILINGLRNNAILPLGQFDIATKGLPLPGNIYDPGFDVGRYENKFKRELPNVEQTLENIVKQLERFGLPYSSSDEGRIKPKAFIAHGGRASRVLEKLRDFIEALGIEPIIVELSASEGMSVDEKVTRYIKDADCGIVLATSGGIVDTTSNRPKQHPRLNVIDELERLRAAFPERTILLLEAGVDLPSNVSGLTFERFARQSMGRAFTAIAREFSAFGILKAVKPKKERKS